MRPGPVAVLALALLACPSAAVGQEEVDLSDIGYVVGEDTAWVTVVEFGDYACSACALFHRSSWPTIQRELIDTGRVVWRHVPFLLGFRRGEDGTRAAVCAADQGAFWPMHDRLFRDQGEWASERRPKDTLVRYAAELGLDVQAFRTCWDDDHPEDRIDRANDAAEALGVRVTPVFFIDGFRVQGALPPEAFLELVQAAERRRTPGG